MDKTTEMSILELFVYVHVHMHKHTSASDIHAASNKLADRIVYYYTKLEALIFQNCSFRENKCLALYYRRQKLYFKQSKTPPLELYIYLKEDVCESIHVHIHMHPSATDLHI